MFDMKICFPSDFKQKYGVDTYERCIIGWAESGTPKFNSDQDKK